MSQRHATDVVSLIFGIIFAGLTVVWVVGGVDATNIDQVWLAGPVILVAAGTAGLIAALRNRDEPT